MDQVKKINFFSSLLSLRKDRREKHLRAREQKAIMNAISDPLLAVDLHGAPLFYNSPFTLLVGETDLSSRRLWKLIIDSEILKSFQLALSEGKTSNVKAVSFNLPAGKMYFSVSVSPLFTSDHDVYGALGVFHDVTHLKQAEKIRMEFVANVSHELRTPLTAIKGYADTIIQDLTAGQEIRREFLEVIARNSDRLMNLINDLLDLSAIESGDFLQKIEVSTEELTSRVIKQLQGRLESKKQKLNVSYEAGSVIADPRRVEQVIVNLLDNANKYTPLDGNISLIWKVDDNADVLFKISDNGPGIQAKDQVRLFERFYRIDKARSRELGGTGLGLAIVKHIMERHDGSIKLESTPGLGATFICRFPSKE